MLKVASILAQESRRPESTSFCTETSSGQVDPSQNCGTSNPHFTAWGLHRSVKMSMELFAQYFSITDDAKSHILRSSACIDSLFDLFWEEGLRKYILDYVLELMKVHSGFILPLFI